MVFQSPNIEALFNYPRKKVEFPQNLSQSVVGLCRNMGLSKESLRQIDEKERVG